MSLVELQEIKKEYPLGRTSVHALKGVSFTIKAGEFVSLMGPSGSGKSTLLNIVGCIDGPTGGAVLVEDRNVADLSDNEQAEMRLRKIGFIFQSFNLIPVLNIYENIEFPAVLAGTPKGERRDYIMHLIERVELQDFIQHKPDELSGGQRQRVAIARALVNRPRLVIADEPTGNLDTETGERVLELMRELNNRDKVTFLFATHDPEVTKYAGRVGRLRDGLVSNDREV